MFGPEWMFCPSTHCPPFFNHWSKFVVKLNLRISFISSGNGSMGVIFQSSKDAQEQRVCLGGGGEEMYLVNRTIITHEGFLGMDFSMCR
jgi:hypothetical protein